MHTLENFQSKDLSTSSKTSRNVVESSPLGTIGKREGRKGNISRQKCKNVLGPPPNRKYPPQDTGNEIDTSGSNNYESVGSNSPAFEGANETFKSLRGCRFDKASPNCPIKANTIHIQENSRKSHVGTKQSGKTTTEKSTQIGNHEPKSTVTIFYKNSSRNVITHEEKQLASNNIHDVSLQKNIEVGMAGSSRLTQQTLKEVSSTDNTNYSASSRNVVRDAPSLQSNSQLIKNLEDHIYFDEGDGGGPTSTTNQRSISKYHKHYAPVNQHQDVQDHQDFHDGNGGRYNSTRYVPSRRGRLQRHPRQSRERSGGTKRGSRESSTRSRARSHKSYQKHSGSSSKRSSTGSRGGSQQSSSHSSRSQKRHRRKRRGGSHQSRSPNSQSGSESWMGEDGLSTLIGHKPYPANWRCFGRRPPAICEFRPLGEVRLENVRPAGKLGYLMRNADDKHGCQGPEVTDTWDNCYGLAKPLTCQWSSPIPYGTKVIRTGDIDPYFCPSRGDLVIINPAQNFYLAMKSGYVMTYCGRGYSFGVGDLIVRLGRFMPSGEYIPYGNLELYMHTQTRDMRLLGCQPSLLVDFNYHNLDYESPGRHPAIGTFLNETFFPRRGDIIICGDTWAENYPSIQCKHYSSVKYWRPRMEFLPNDILLRPYVDIGRKSDQSGHSKFYWGAIELYTYSGKGLAWAYWGRDDHICDTPYPFEQEHGIKTGYHKDEVGHYADMVKMQDGRYGHGHQAHDGYHIEHKLSQHHRQGSLHGHQASDDCHSEHELYHHSHS